MMDTTVFVITWCQNAANVYGSTLVFESLRVGFPTASVIVADNASLPEVRPMFRRRAARVGAEYRQIEKMVDHEALLTEILGLHPGRRVVFVDPDVVFWECVEGWHFDALAAGRLIPAYRCEYTGCATYPRLHTSLLFIPDVEKLREAVTEIHRKHFEFRPFRPAMFRALDGLWWRLETGSSLYMAMPDRMYAFSTQELNAYDHLFVGSHLDAITEAIDPTDAKTFIDIHAQAKTDWRRLRGIWRWQQDYFNRRAIAVI